MNKKLQLNFLDALVLMLFVAETPDERIEDQQIADLKVNFNEALIGLQNSPAFKTLEAMGVGAQYITADGTLSRYGQHRALQMFRAGIQRPVNYQEMVDNMGIKQLLALTQAVVPALQARIVSKESFTPSEQVKELCEKNGDILYALAGVELEEEEVIS